MMDIRLIRADNPGPMTLEGTNTWLIPDGMAWTVVDPGPLKDAHLRAIEAATDATVSRVLLTHAHPDHAEGAAEFARRVGTAVFASRLSAERLPHMAVESIADEEEWRVGSATLRTLHTPGHTGDSTTFLVRDEGQAALLTGDTVLGRGTTVLIPPDGRLVDYLASLERLEWIASELEHEGIPVALLPGHGPTHADAVPLIASYINHREERLEQVRALVREGITDADELVRRIYADVPENVKAAALLSVQAQLEYLADQ